MSRKPCCYNVLALKEMIVKIFELFHYIILNTIVFPKNKPIS